MDQLRALAESGDTGAQLDLGLSLSATDSKAAMTWFERAAMQGEGAAAYEMGVLQDDPKRAVEWYSMASAMGHIGAQYQLGDAYLNGRGTAKEPGWGMMWVERAARAGHVEAQFAMSTALATGLTGAVQREDALVWALIAQSNNREGLNSVISALKARMMPGAIRNAQQRAANWSDAPADEAKYDRATLRFAQYALGRLGFEPGPADGIPGVRSEAAIAAFRADNGLGEGGVDGRMLDQLRERMAKLNR